EEVPRRLGRVRCLVVVGEFEQWCVHEHGEHEHEHQTDQRGDEFDREQMWPDVDLVLRTRANILDRTRSNHGEQAMGVPTWTRTDGKASGCNRTTTGGGGHGTRRG